MGFWKVSTEFMDSLILEHLICFLLMEFSAGDWLPILILMQSLNAILYKDIYCM